MLPPYSTPILTSAEYPTCLKTFKNPSFTGGKQGHVNKNRSCTKHIRGRNAQNACCM